MHSSACLSHCAYIFLLFCLPIHAFAVFLVFYYFAKTIFLAFACPSLETVHMGPSRKLATPRASDLFRSSLLVLLLPYMLFGIAFLLQASSSTLAHLSDRIPYQNAGAAFIVECSLRAFSWIRARPKVSLEQLNDF